MESQTSVKGQKELTSQILQPAINTLIERQFLVEKLLYNPLCLAVGQAMKEK